MGIYDAYSTGVDNARRRQREDQQLREHDEQRAYQRDYASAYGAGEFNRAQKLAGQYGDIEGVTGARTGQQQVTEQQRLEAYREVRPFYDELTMIGQEPEETRAQRYQQWAQRVHQAVADDPQLSQWAQQNVPLDTYNPQVQGYLQNRLQTMLESLMSPDELAQMQVRRDSNQRVTLTPEEVEAEGLRPGTVAQRDATGRVHVVQSPLAPTSGGRSGDPTRLPSGYVLD